MKYFIASLLAFASTSSFAETVTVDFQSLEFVAPSDVFVNSEYIEDGYTLRAHDRASFFTLGTLSADYKGSTALAIGAVNDFATLTKNDSASFTLNSIDLAELRNNVPGANVTFIGTKLDSSTVTQTFTVTGNFVTFNFSGFDNLTKVDWSQIAPYYQFDNIVVTSIAAVPEPETYTMLLAGLSLVGFAAKRKKLA